MARRYSLVGRAAVIAAGVYALLVTGSLGGVIEPEPIRMSLILLFLLALVWLFVRWRNGWRWSVSPLNMILLAGLVVVALATAANLDSWRRITIGLWYWGLYLALWLVVTDCLANGLPARWLLDTVLVAGGIVLLFGYLELGFNAWPIRWLQVVGAGIPAPFLPARPISIFSNANALGTVLIVMIMLALGRLMQARRWVGRLAWLCYISLSGLLLLFSMSRGAIFGLMCGGLAWLLMMLYQRGWLAAAVWRMGWARLGGIIRVLVVVAVLVTVFAIFVPDGLSSVFFPAGRGDLSPRMLIWQASLAGIQERPIIGSGPFTFGRTLLQHQSSPPHGAYHHAHNLWLNTAVELGLVGAAVLLIWCGGVVVLWWRRLQQISSTAHQYEHIAVGSTLVAFAGHHLLDDTVTILAVAFVALVLVAVAVSESYVVVARSHKMNQLGPILTTGLWAVLLLSGWWSYTVRLDYSTALKVAETEDWRAGGDHLADVVRREPGNPLYPGVQGYMYGVAAHQGDSLAADAGVAALERALQIEDLYAPWWANLGALHWQTGDVEKALAAMEDALARAPESALIQFNLGLMYEAVGEAVAAQTAFEHALVYEKRPYLVELSFWQETAPRQQALADYQSANPPTDVQETRTAVLTHFAAGEYEAIVTLLVTDPATAAPSAENRVLLALAYERLGEPELADLWLQSGWLYAGWFYDREWLVMGDAVLANWRGDEAASAFLATAYDYYEDSAYRWAGAGSAYAWLQFSRPGISEQFLPQLYPPSFTPPAQTALAMLLE